MSKITVLMPTYNQASFIRRAYKSLQSQVYTDWELIIINDGCTDETETIIQDIIQDPKVIYLKNEQNQGLGFSLNRGLDHATGNYIAYLPSDDIYYDDHLLTLKTQLEEDENIALAFSGVVYAQNDSLKIHTETDATFVPTNHSLQLVQVCHRKTDDRWLERCESVTEDLFLMYWNKLTKRGTFRGTLHKSCFWSRHPDQRVSMICENFGGNFNKYRAYYKVQTPLRFRTHKYKFIDEKEDFSPFRKKYPLKEDGLKILILGELSYNPERMYAFEEQGHQLYGSWIEKPPFPLNYIGKLPFGNIQDIPFDENWIKEVKRIKPDIIYALGNLPAVSFVTKCIQKIKKELPGTPFVWHFKEGPLTALQFGNWKDLIYLYSHADGNIYLNKLSQEWIKQFIINDKNDFILDMDLPKKDYFTNDFKPKLSEKDGATHTFVAGRVIGIGEDDIRMLAQNNIHLHIYSESFHYFQLSIHTLYQAIAPNYIHLHKHCPNNKWVSEFSQYDAGWLHLFDSKNEGDLLKLSWDDLNLPCRTASYVAAGVPMISKKNSNHLVAVNELLRQHDIGLFIEDVQDLSEQVKDKEVIQRLSRNVIKAQKEFMFDTHIPSLIEYFRNTINLKKKNNER